MRTIVADITSILRRINGWTIAAAVFLFVLFTALSVRSADEYRWSDWGFGDAQTLLSLKQWEEGGWLHNYLLFKPQGYASVIDLLDEPELRHHAHGTCPGSSPNVGPRLWYTHYPPGYLIPYAVFFRLGLDSMFAVRMLSLIFSFTALVLMFILFSRIANHAIAFLSVLFYAISPAFLGYADSLANQPVDDMLRFGFMLAVVMSTRAPDALQKRWLIAAWVMEFCLSLVSFDSVFFLYVWLVGWDMLEGKGFRWKRYLIFAAAPVSAHALQFFQNVWYLGFDDALLDIKDAFLLKHGTDKGYNLGQGRFDIILSSLSVVFRNIFDPIWLLFLVLILYYIGRRFLIDEQAEVPSFKLLMILFLCGLSFILVLPHAARMPYEARQMIPFSALLVAAFTWSLPKIFYQLVSHGKNESSSGETEKTSDFWTSALYIFTSLTVLLFMWYRFAMLDRQPIYDLGPRKEEMLFAQKLQHLQTRYEPVYFDSGGFSLFWDPAYVPGYPQILPLTEYYAGSRPILCFDNPEKIVDDLIIMMNKSSSPFSPVVISRDHQQLINILNALEKRGILRERPISVPQADGRFAMDLTDYILWR